MKNFQKLKNSQIKNYKLKFSQAKNFHKLKFSQRKKNQK